MTSQQLYDEALKYIEGKGGYPKNPKKGQKAMMEAAEGGHVEAARYCITHYAKTEKEKLHYFNKNPNVRTGITNEYVRCLYVEAQAMMKKKKTVGDTFFMANLSKDTYHDDGYYYFAELGKLAGKDDAWYRDTLYLAALGSSKVMPDSAYAYINRTRGVIEGKVELDAWVKANKLQDNIGGYGEVTKTAEEAWRIVEANLSAKETVKLLPPGAARHILKAGPCAVLEYQRVIAIYAKIKDISVGFEYDNPKYSQVTTGTLTDYTVDVTRGHWYTDFQYGTKQTEAWKKFRDLSYKSTTPNARVRISTNYYGDLLSTCADQAKSSVMWAAKSTIKEDLGKAKNWPTQYISLNVKEHDTSISSLKIYFVPFYYFNYELSKSKTITLRVNAQTGEFEWFENAPFGQFTEYDDYKVGGGAKLNKDLVNARKYVSNTVQNEKIKKTAIVFSVAAVVCFILIAVFQNTDALAIICFLASIACAAFAVFNWCKLLFNKVKRFFKK